VAVVDRLIKQRKDSVAAYEQAGRTDLADREKAEAAILQTYLPERLDTEAIQAAVRAIVAQLSNELGRTPTVADMGKLMGAAKAQLAGKADMAQVSAAVKAALNKPAT
jgi:uncharacterized protein YqeY